MTSTLQDFVASIGRPIQSFPPGLRQTYHDMMEDFRSDDAVAGFDQLNTQDGFEDETLRGVAHRLYWWFPTHFFKVQQSLLLWEEQCRKSGTPFLLDRPKVTFADLGSGAGAASAAVLAVLEQYHCFRRAKGLLVDPVDVRLVGLDRVGAELATYDSLIGSYADRIRHHGVLVRSETLEGEFPSQTSELVEILSRVPAHTIIVGMSNLINWIWKEYDAYLGQNRLADAAALSSVESNALRLLAEEVPFDYFHVIGIAVKNRKYWHLPRKLEHFFSTLLAALRLARRPFGTRWGSNAHVVFENPEGSRWVSDRPRGNSDYYVENLVDAAPRYVQDSKAHEALSLSSLEAAWAKVRCHMRYESLTDGVELKLFESDLGDNLAKLRGYALDRCFDRLSIQEHLPYEFPKNATETRPRSLVRLEDQILTAAICVNSREELEGPCPEVSYNYKLAMPKSEFLYEYWFAAYREYLGDALRSFNGGHVFATDIQSYYMNVRQSLLLTIVQRRLGESTRCCEVLTPIIRRDCRAQHSAGYGLLQGHALSGLLSNVMLQPVDLKLISESGLDDRYFRFTDDIIVTRTPGPHSNVEGVIQGQLSAYDNSGNLLLNPDKTHYFAEPDFKKRISGYKRFDSLGTRFRALLLPLFLANATYRWEFRRTDWSFVHEYARMLERIGIHFSVEWLHRKIDEYGKTHRWIRSLGRKWHVSWPPFSLTESASGRRNWRRQFESSNPEWMREKRQLERAFTRMFAEACRELIAGNLSDSDRIRRKRAVKFALFRLGVFDVSGARDAVVGMLISQPWNIPIGIACHALAKANCVSALEAIIQQSTSPYVRANALRALGKIRIDESVSLLRTVLNSHASKIERLMASEALLDANLWHDIEPDTIIDWLQNEDHHPYVQKNIVLILGQAHPDAARPFLQEMDDQRLHSIVHRAIHYVLTKPVAENLLWKSEPEVLKKYRAKFYPTIEELLGDEGSYVLISS